MSTTGTERARARRGGVVLPPHCFPAGSRSAMTIAAAHFPSPSRPAACRRITGGAVYRERGASVDKRRAREQAVDDVSENREQRQRVLENKRAAAALVASDYRPVRHVVYAEMRDTAVSRPREQPTRASDYRVAQNNRRRPANLANNLYTSRRASGERDVVCDQVALPHVSQHVHKLRAYQQREDDVYRDALYTERRAYRVNANASERDAATLLQANDNTVTPASYRHALRAIVAKHDTTHEQPRSRCARRCRRRAGRHQR